MVMEKSKRIIRLTRSNMNKYGIKYSILYLWYKITRNDEKRIELMMGYLKQELKDLIDKFNNEYGKTCKSENESVVKNVWVCWWQGYTDMPEICKCCLKSLEQHLYSDASLHFVTLDNYQNYVDIPKSVMNLYREKKISLTILSDVLRSCLLAQYGGLWIDSTMLVTDAIDFSEFKEKKWWSIKLPASKLDRESFGQKITKGNWASFIQYGIKGNVVNRFLYESFQLFLEKYEEPIDYFMQNLIIKLAFENLEEAKHIFSELEISNEGVYDLYRRIDEAYDDKEWTNLVRKTKFHKLTWKNIYSKKTEKGIQTYYGYVTNKYNEKKNYFD